MMKKIKPVKIRVSEEFVKMLDVERNLEPERMNRIKFTQKKAEQLKDDLFKRFKKRPGMLDDFKI